MDEEEFLIETFVAESDSTGIRVRGEVDTATADRLFDAVRSLPRSNETCIVDLADCDFLDSSGIRALLLSQRHLDGSGGTLRLVNVPAHIDRVLRIAGVQEVIKIEG